MRRRWWAVLMVLVAVASTVAWWRSRGREISHPTELTADSVSAVRMEFREAPSIEEGTIELRERDRIAALLTLLNSGQRHPNHKCAPRATVHFATTGGQGFDLQLFPGHGRDTYEYRCPAGVFRLERRRFMSTMGALGVKAEYLIRDGDDALISAH